MAARNSDGTSGGKSALGLSIRICSPGHVRFEHTHPFASSRSGKREMYLYIYKPRSCMCQYPIAVVPNYINWMALPENQQAKCRRPAAVPFSEGAAARFSESQRSPAAFSVRPEFVSGFLGSFLFVEPEQGGRSRVPAVSVPPGVRSDGESRLNGIFFFSQIDRGSRRRLLYAGIAEAVEALRVWELIVSGAWSHSPHGDTAGQERCRGGLTDFTGIRSGDEAAESVLWREFLEGRGNEGSAEERGSSGRSMWVSLPGASFAGPRSVEMGVHASKRSFSASVVCSSSRFVRPC
ncbi:uncharacterized protein [Excalfactoria chinensis]|uniref:uncharacterized protein n=1 Tax=Excalfactoria chinensis TaxID=46218 RepID=UPI003B3A5009